MAGCEAKATLHLSATVVINGLDMVQCMRHSVLMLNTFKALVEATGKYR